MVLALVPLALPSRPCHDRDGQSNRQGMDGNGRRRSKFIYLVGLADGFRQAAGELMTDLFPVGPLR